jgi:hypothetical protein
VTDPVALLRHVLETYTFADSRAAVADAVRDLERRRSIERRLEKWLDEPETLRSCTQSSLGTLLRDYRAQADWFSPAGDGDRHAQLEAALTAAGAGALQ